MQRSFRILTLAAAILLGGSAAYAQPLPASAVAGSFSVLTYNVAGLPEGLSSGNPATNTPLISPRLSAYDIVNVQEDFNYHAALYAGDNHPHRTPTSGGAGIGDGTNTLSILPYTDLNRIKWTKCNGTDCLTPKGFSFSRLRLAEGVYVDLYNLHPNAGSADADLAARRANITQLTEFIIGNSAGNAVLVMGDTNTRYTRAGDNIRDLTDRAGLTDPWVHLVRGGHAPAIGSPALVCDPEAVSNACEVVDKIFYRSNRFITLNARYYNNDNTKFLDSQNKPLSDHYPHTVGFDWSADDRIRMSDQFGGPHGTPFTDLDRLTDGIGARSVTLRGGDRLNRIGATLSDGTVVSHGGEGGAESSLSLGVGEHLVRVVLTQGKHNGRTRIFSAQLATDLGRTVSAGKPTGDTVTYTAPPGWRIAGFTGRAGDEIDKLGVIYLPR